MTTDVSRESDLAPLQMKCDVCDKEARIFQVTGNYCLACWQEKTTPDISLTR